jgi:cyanate lyase
VVRLEFGDGIMSAIDFSMDIKRESDPKFLPYKTY